ncbi:VOC family protein [Roseateles asaccharophilus]|uniref:Catechol 2,3-dioxygenase-like lactoylglutathione lyase family enzyme n=1 Tax=Roseateles asaccharophilus TaxID=582607 RepID=A0ABU2AEP8_9BURK|nr:VOC family protein [Roseateles asaccharophilus]MDR7335689.1 catechol 2,3-dioxygenase-like lactoylglutathione lyase family enzyme [Roseateles asaccharophilus]
MPVQLDHLLVPARDGRAAAERLAAILGVPWAAQAAVGPFSAVYVSGDLTLDFDEVAPGDAVPALHFAFRVSEPEFDALLARLKALGIAYRSLPHGPDDHQVNTSVGGRLVYWREPDGHAWEALTQSYARQP